MNVVFHVINSIKGGCGKSTISMLLANYYQMKNEKAYIIDLDWYGSSWFKNYENYVNNNETNKLEFINHMLLDFSQKSSTDYITEIKLKHDKANAQPLNVCLAKPDEIDLGEEEQDLFENTINKLIQLIIDTNLGKANNDILHIILDMPPSYESYSERIIHHLLLDHNSNLYHEFQFGKYSKKESACTAFIKLYLISALSLSHVHLNIEYLKKFHNSLTYSSVLQQLYNEKLKKNRSHPELNTRFEVIFIINDVNQIILGRVDDLFRKINLVVENNIPQEISDAFSVRYSCLRYIRMAYFDDVFKNIGASHLPKGSLILNTDTISGFEEMMTRINDERMSTNKSHKS